MTDRREAEQAGTWGLGSRPGPARPLWPSLALPALAAALGLPASGLPEVEVRGVTVGDVVDQIHDARERAEHQEGKDRRHDGRGIEQPLSEDEAWTPG